MDIPFLLNLVEYAIEREQEQRLHDQYCAVLPYMGSDSFKTFSEWKNEAIKPKRRTNYYESRSTEEIMKELKGGGN